MSKTALRLLSAVITLIMIGAFWSAIPSSAASVDVQHYENYGTIIELYNMNSCTGMQGMAVDEQYLYNVKVNSATETDAFIADFCSVRKFPLE